MAIEEMTEIKAGDMTEAQAKVLAKRVARLIASTVLGDLNVRLTVTKIFEQLDASEGSVYDEGFSEFVSELICLIELSEAGIQARLNASSEEAANAIEAREQAVKVATEAAAEGDTESLPVLEGLMRAAEESNHIAKGLYEPIKQNLQNVLAAGNQASIVKHLRRGQASQTEDAMHDSNCNDPNCGAHTNH